MFQKVNNKILGIIFGILVLIGLFLFVFDGGKTERTFREVLVDIDTIKVTEILIYPKSQNHKEVKLYKEKEGWRVILPSGVSSKVLNDRINNLFAQLMAIKPKRLAARDESKWNELQVDSTGSRVKVFEGSKLALDLVIGRFSFQQPRTMNTFVRLYNDKDVYEVDGFLDMTFNQGANIFRDGTVIKSDYNNWQQLQFTYPADSSFKLVKSANNWLLNGKLTDSLNTVNYLNRLANLSNNSFVDNVKIEPSSIPTYSLNITTSDLKFIEIKGYLDSTSSIIHSSQNPEAWFDGSSLSNTIFVGRSSFLSK
ncbi:MAG: DUF4340 domain-containing protein [Ignavibacteriaceae bacterium]|jgi:hypothetical protein|nr:DUF4340 domain-containing protein [Ignavibacteriaceae bacterium]